VQVEGDHPVYLTCHAIYLVDSCQTLTLNKTLKWYCLNAQRKKDICCPVEDLDRGHGR